MWYICITFANESIKEVVERKKHGGKERSIDGTVIIKAMYYCVCNISMYNIYTMTIPQKEEKRE